MLQQVYFQLFSAYWWLIPIVIIIGCLKSPYIKGVIGEFKINFCIQHLLDNKFYTLFKNVTLPTKDGTTQIDHIIVSRYGIFVIETKNLKGWIFGSTEQDMWTQKLFRYNSQFQNPLRQNYKHTQTLQSILSIDSRKLFSLVVFVGDSKFKTPMPENVIDHGYIRYIKSKKEMMLSEIEVKDICEKIASNRLSPSLRTHIDHVEHLRKKHQQRHTNNNYPVLSKAIALIAIGTGVFGMLLTLKDTMTLPIPQPHTNHLGNNRPLNSIKNTFNADNISPESHQILNPPADDNDPKTNPSQWDFISSKDKKCWFHKKTRRKVCEALQ